MTSTYTVREELDDLDRAELHTLASLPTWEARRTDESLQAYGSRALQFLLAFSCTAPLSDEDLQLAEHVAIYAVASRDISPIALAKISACRHLIASILRGRQKAQPAATLPPTRDDRPNTGPMAKLIPEPAQRPPGGAYADSRPNLIDSIRQTLTANGTLKPGSGPIDVGF